MRLIFTFLAALALSISFASGQAASQDGFITRPSAYTFDETVVRLRKAITGMGMSLMAEVDHAKGAADSKMKLRPTYLLLFGNPQVGTHLMQADQRAGLDLPLRLLVWEDERGKVYLSYRQPQDLQQDFKLQEQKPVLEKMGKVFEKLSETVSK